MSKYSKYDKTKYYIDEDNPYWYYHINNEIKYLDYSLTSMIDEKNNGNYEQYLYFIDQAIAEEELMIEWLKYEHNRIVDILEKKEGTKND